MWKINYHYNITKIYLLNKKNKKMNKKLILLAVASLTIAGYTFAETGAATTWTTTPTTATATSGSTTDGGDSELESLLNDTGSEDTASTGTTASSWAEVKATTATWGYSDTDTLSAVAQGSSIVITSPIVKDASGKQILTYVVKYSTKSMSEKIDSLEGATSPQEKSFTFVLSWDLVVLPNSDMSWSATDISMKIDGLSSGTYYFIVTPKTADNVDGNASKEITATVGEATADHNAAGMSWSAGTQDITVISGTATVTWSPIAGASKMQIFAKFGSDADYKKISEVDASKWTYSFKAQSKGDFLVKLIAVDSAGATVWAEQILTGKGDVSINAPKVGPASTLVIGMLLLSIVWYVTYRFRKLRS